MRTDVDPPALAPDDGLREVAALLAAGLLRIHAHAVADQAKSSAPRKLV
jgi:hypothetical protein